MNDRFKFRVVRGKNPFTPTGTVLHFALGDEVGFGQGDIIEQCTGLKDKNGKLIYESDYVKDKDGDIYLVKWDSELVQFQATGKDNCGFETITPFMKGETETLEICGNIHEQAEQKE